MLKKLTVMALALIIALASVCLPSFADSGADISAAAAQSGDARGESAAQAEPGGAEAGPGASAGADGEEAVLYDDAETALSIMNELPATITATQAVQAGHVMRLKAEEPDLNTVVFKNGDGTRTAYQYAVPVKYVENGEIKDKSSRLVATDKGGYAYENEANEVKTYFPQGLGEKGARLEYGGYALELTPVTAETLGVYSAGSSLAAGGSVLRNVTEAADGMNYAGALGEGISLRYTPTLTGLKEDIILDSYTGRSSFSFRLRTEGLELCEISGNWYLSDPESGEIVVELGEIYIHDSYTGNVAEGEQSAHEAYGCITAETIEEGEEYILSVHAPAEYLSAPGTVYPVYIDPTFNVVNTYIQDTHISSGYPSKNYNTASLLNLGHGTSSKSTRILVMITNMVNGQTRPGLDASSINSATYHMYCTSSYTSNPYVDVYRVKNSWSNTGATWSNASSSTLSGATLVSSTRVGNKGWYEFDITDLGREWLKYETRNYGTETGKSAEYGYSFFSSGPGVIILASADSSSNSAYVSFNYTEDTSLADGTYIIKNKLTGRAMQDNGSPASLGYYNPAQTNQQWIFTKDSNGFYTIKNVNTGRYIYFTGVAISGSVLQTGSTQMQWRVLKNDDGSYRLFPNNCIYAIEERWYNDYDYKVYAEGYNGYINQRWDLVPVADQVAVKLPNGTYIQRSKTIYDDNGDVDVEYKNESGVALEVNDSKQIIIEPIVITDITASGDNWHKSVAAPFTYSVTGSDKISVSRSGNTLTITGQALGEASITVTSGDAQTTIPVVVANKVLDVPLERQVWNQSCWAACGSMVIKGMISSFNYPLQLADDAHNNDENYPAYNDTQYDIIEKVKGSRIKNNTNNKPASSDYIINALKDVSGNEISGVKVEAENFSQTLLRQKLDAGSPVIYLTRKYNSYSSEWTGHFRVIYGYYWLESAEKYVYLVCDPWNTCMKYNENTIGNNVHLDIWRRSWENILDEKEKGISGLDIAVTSSYLTFYTREFIYFDLL